MSSKPEPVTVGRKLRTTGEKAGLVSKRSGRSMRMRPPATSTASTRATWRAVWALISDSEPGSSL